MSERLQILIDAVFRGKGEVDAAKRSMQGLGDETEKAKSRTDALAKIYPALKLAATGALAGVGYAMLNFTRQSIGMASQVEEAASKFQFVFGPAAEAAGQALDEFAAAAGRSRYELRETAAGFGGILEGMLGSKEAAADMSVELARLTTDLASFYNVAESDAATALTSGLVGQTEPMRRFGVLLSAAAVEAEVLSSGMAKTKDEITETMKVQARFNLIMQATATAQGDAIRTSDSYANQQRAMKAAFEELSVAIGQMLLPAATEATGKIGELVKQFQIWIDINREGTTAVDEISRRIIDEAQGVDDLADAYKRATDQLGIMSHLTGLTDDIYMAQERYLKQMAISASSFDEYISGLQRAGIAGERIAKGQEELFKSWYDGARAAGAYAKALQEAAGADGVMLSYARAAAEIAEETAIATYSTDAWEAAVARQVTQSRDAAIWMKHQADRARELAENTAKSEAAIKAQEQALLNWYDAALKGAEGAFIVDKETGEMQSSIENANREIYNMIAATGDAAPEALALLGVALGIITEEQADAALKTMLFNAALKEMADRAMEDGELTRSEIFAIREQTQLLLEDINALPPLINLEYQSNAHEAEEEARRVKAAAEAAAGTYNIAYSISTLGNFIPPAPNVIAQPFASGTGGQFLSVPPGYPNDSYLVALQSGEDFMVRTPADRQSGAGGVTVNIDARGAGAGVSAEIERAVHMALANAGWQTDRRARVNYVSI